MMDKDDEEKLRAQFCPSDWEGVKPMLEAALAIRDYLHGQKLVPDDMVGLPLITGDGIMDVFLWLSKRVEEALAQLGVVEEKIR